jgi:CubicO group peptidase (beta-lactamase class C family)
MSNFLSGAITGPRDGERCDEQPIGGAFMKPSGFYSTLVALLLLSTVSLSVSQITAVPLVLGKSIPDSLPRNGSKSYTLRLAQDRFIYGEVDQITVDVVVRIFDPEGKRLAEFDGPARGPEPFKFKSAKAGDYRIDVSPFQQNTGRFAVRLIAEEPVATTPAGKIDQIMVSFSQPGTAGGVVAVTQVDRILFAKGYGLADVEYGIPNTTRTPFHLASVSKQFTAFAIVLLAQQGKLSLEDDVRKSIPELHDFGVRITLRHLLNHTSGLRDQWDLWVMSGHRMDDVIRQQDLMTLMINQRELNFKPGAEHLYCNSGYMLLSEVVARVSGMPFKEYLKRNVLDPLGMHDTQVYDDHQRIVKGRAYSYVNSEDGLKKSVLSYANAGATSLFSTAEDLAKWIRNWKNGTVGGQKALSEMQVRGILNNGDTLTYALGIDVRGWRGLYRISHGGADAGYRTYIAYFPEIDAGVITLGNDGSFNSGAIATEAIEAFFGDKLLPEPPSPSQPARKAEEQWKPTKSELARYAGRYFSDELETFYVVSVKDSNLVAYHRRLGGVVLTPGTKLGQFRSDQFALQNVQFTETETGLNMFVTTGRVRNLKFRRVDTEKEF